VRESIGHIQLYNIIIVFFFLVMAILAGTTAYNRTFKVSTRIVGSIEKYEGYNALARAQIEKDLSAMAYSTLNGKTPSCPSHWGGHGLVSPTEEQADYAHNYCVYRSDLETYSSEHGFYNIPSLSFKYYTVVTYSSFDLLPYWDMGGIPTVARTNRIFCFGGGCS